MRSGGSVKRSASSFRTGSSRPARSDTGRSRPRLLALHGAKSNNDVTKMQLDNLQITSKVADIVYLHGKIEVEEGDPALSELVHGPFFSWIDEAGGSEEVRESLIAAVQHVMATVQQLGPFDGIFGFSQGGMIASLASNIADDDALKVVRQLRHHFGPSLRDIWALCHPTHAVRCALLGYHAY